MYHKIYAQLKVSPSHTVGLEPLPYTVEIRLGCSKQSPSHTVGSEL